MSSPEWSVDDALLSDVLTATSTTSIPLRRRHLSNVNLRLEQSTPSSPDDFSSLLRLFHQHQLRYLYHSPRRCLYTTTEFLQRLFHTIPSPTVRHTEVLSFLSFAIRTKKARSSSHSSSCLFFYLPFLASFFTSTSVKPGDSTDHFEASSFSSPPTQDEEKEGETGETGGTGETPVVVPVLSPELNSHKSYVALLSFYLHCVEDLVQFEDQRAQQRHHQQHGHGVSSEKWLRDLWVTVRSLVLKTLPVTDFLTTDPMRSFCLTDSISRRCLLLILPYEKFLDVPNLSTETLLGCLTNAFDLVSLRHVRRREANVRVLIRLCWSDSFWGFVAQNEAFRRSVWSLVFRLVDAAELPSSSVISSVFGREFVFRKLLACSGQIDSELGEWLVRLASKLSFEDELSCVWEALASGVGEMGGDPEGRLVGELIRRLGVVKRAEEKVAVLRILHSFDVTLLSENVELRRMVESKMAGLVSSYSTDDVKMGAIRLVVAWRGRVEQSWSLEESLFQFADKVLSDIRNLRAVEMQKQMLRLLYVVGRAENMRESLKTRYSRVLLALIEASERRLVFRMVGAIAMRVLLRISPTYFASGKLNSIVGYLLSDETFRKASTVDPLPDLTDFLGLLSSLAIHYSNVLSAPSRSRVLSFLVKTLLKSPPLRRAARLNPAMMAELDRVRKTREVQSSNGLFYAFLAELSLPQEDTSEHGLASQQAMTQLLLLPAALPQIEDSSSVEFLVDVFCAACHPRLLVQAWKKIAALPAVASFLEDLDRVRAVCARLFAMNSHDDLDFRKAASRSFRIVLFATSHRDHVLSIVESKLDEARLRMKEFSRTDIRIYETREDRVFWNLKNELLNSPHLRRDQQTQRSQYSLTPDEWEDVMAQASERKKAQVNVKLDDIRLAVLKDVYLQKEALVRIAVRQCRDSVEFALSSVMAMTEARSLSESIHALGVHRFLFPTVDLLSSSIYKILQLSFECFRKLVCLAFAASQAAPQEWKFPFAKMLAHATLRMVNPRGDRSCVLRLNNISRFSGWLVNSLKEATTNRTLEPQTFLVVLPFLRSLLHNQSLRKQKKFRYEPKVFSDGLDVLVAHANLDYGGMGDSRPTISRILTEVILNFPDLVSKAQAALVSSASTFLPKDIGPLLDHEVLFSEYRRVRKAILRTLQRYPPLMDHRRSPGDFLSRRHLFENPHPSLISRVWMTQFDADSTLAPLGRFLWRNYWANVERKEEEEEEGEESVSASSIPGSHVCDHIQIRILPFLSSKSEFVRTVSAKSLSATLSLDLSSRGQLLGRLLEQFSDKRSQPRKLAVIRTLTFCFLKFSTDEIVRVMRFVIYDGLFESTEVVREQTAALGFRIVKSSAGEKCPEEWSGVSAALVRLFDQFLQEKDKRSSARDDFPVGNVAAWHGIISRGSTDEGVILAVVGRLIKTLAIPSNAVQTSVLEALSPLLARLPKPKVEEFLLGLLETFSRGTYGERRGRAFGITACILGGGIWLLPKHRIMSKLYDMLQDRDPMDRQTAAITIELLASFLKVLFQPQVPEILPKLLMLCGTDPEPEVMKACDRALSAVEKTLCETTVRMVLPSVLSTLNDSDLSPRLRVKCCEVIGQSAHFGRRTMMHMMPNVVDTLLTVVGVINKDVAQAASTALHKVGSVVQNPDMIHVLPKVINALANPSSDAIRSALTDLVGTNFTHTLDTAGVTLLVPFLLRGLGDREIEVNDTSAKVVGLLSTLIIDDRQILAYLPRLLEVLKKHCIGPHPRVRASTAKAIGSLAKLCEGGAGSGLLDETMSWIQDFMNLEDVNDVERDGTAMAFAEILAAQGPDRVRATHFESILANCEHRNAGIRHGYLKMLMYLPMLMKEAYQPFLKESLARTLDGLADEDETVRNTCYEGSGVMIRNFGMQQLSMILPVLLSGVQNEMWLTRFKCLRLLAQLLQKVSDEKCDDAFAPDIYSLVSIDYNALVRELTEETTFQILATVFVLQSDEVPNVKSQAVVLWRSIVDVMNKQVVLDILPLLLDLIVENLSNEEDEDLRKTAARACNMLVEKVGEDIVTRIVPILSDKINSDVSEIRQGVCIGLREIMRASTPRMLRRHTDVLIEVVKLAICDDEIEVQAAAASVFKELTRFVGVGKVTKAIVRTLVVDLLAEKNTHQALSGLTQLIRRNGKIVLPALLPYVMVDDMTPLHFMVLGTVAKVSGYMMNPYLTDVMRKLVVLLGLEGFTSVLAAASDFSTHPLLFCTSQICCSLHDNEDGLEEFMTFISSLGDKSLDVEYKRGLCSFVQIFCFGERMEKPSTSSILMCMDDLRHRIMKDLMQLMIGLFNDESSELVLSASFGAKLIIDRLMSKDEIGHLIGTIRDTVSRMYGGGGASDAVLETVKAFDLEVALAAFLQVFQQGLRHQSAEVKEQSILGIRDFIDLTTERVLQKYVVKFTGALLRYGGYRLPWQTKMVLIATLSKLIDKGGPRILTFTSAMQTIFVKALQSNTAIVRNVAATALGKVVTLGRARIRKLVIELHNVIKTFKIASLAYDLHTASICTGVLRGLELVLANRGQSIGAEYLKEIVETVLTSLIDPSEIANPEIVRSGSNVVGVCFKLLLATPVRLTQEDFIERSIRTQVIVARGALKYCPEGIDEQFTLDLLVKIATDVIQVPEAIHMQAIQLLLPFLLFDLSSGGRNFPSVVTTLDHVSKLRINVARFHALAVIKNLAKLSESPPSVLFPLVDVVLSVSKDRHTPTKLMAERAMFHLLRMKGRDFSLLREFVQEFAAEWPDEKLRLLKSYCKRVERRSRDQEGASDDENDERGVSKEDLLF